MNNQLPKPRNSLHQARDRGRSPSAQLNDTARLIRIYRLTYSALVAAGLLSSLILLRYIFHDSAALHLKIMAWAMISILAVPVGLRLYELRRARNIPGPKPDFLIGNLKDLLLMEHGARDQALVKLHATYGPVVRLHLAWGSSPFVSTNEVPIEMKKQHVDSNRRADRTVLSHSIMGLENGAKHEEHRRHITPHFSEDAVTESMQSMAEVANLYLDAWRHQVYRYGSLKSDVHHWSANSIGIFLCGKNWGEDKNLPEYLQAIAKIEEVISFRSFHPFFVRWLFPAKSHEVRTAYDYLYRYFEHIIALRKIERDLQNPPKDMLETLIDLSLAKGKNSHFWSYADIVEELISLTAGGTDAMSYTMAQALYLLSRHPEIQAKAYSEVLNVDPFDKSCLNPFEEMKYTHNIIRETIRLYPAVPFSSKFFRDRSISIHGVTIPSRTNILWMKTAIGLNESFYKEATNFNPSRYDDIKGVKRESIESMMPFGGGIRHCVGSHLAESLCTRLLASILREFELEPVPEVNVTYNALISVTPSMVPVTLRPRLPIAQQLVT